MSQVLKEKTLEEARQEVEALQPGDVWCTDHPLTFEEFSELVDEDSQAELVDGVIEMSPTPEYEHEAVFMFLSTLLKTYADAKGLGEVLGSRSAVRVDPHNAPQPDILFVRHQRRSIIQRLQIVEPPDVIIEIVSSDSSRRRAMRKMSRYERWGVPEFWYLDVPQRTARIWRLQGDRRYALSFEGADGVLSSPAVPGFSVQAEWIWSGPGNFPSVLDVVTKLLRS